MQGASQRGSGDWGCRCKDNSETLYNKRSGRYRKKGSELFNHPCWGEGGRKALSLPKKSSFGKKSMCLHPLCPEIENLKSSSKRECGSP